MTAAHEWQATHCFCVRCGVTLMAVEDSIGPLACVLTPQTLGEHFLNFLAMSRIRGIVDDVMSRTELVE